VGIGVILPQTYKLDVAGSCHATSFPTSSDLRFKEDVEPLTNVLERLEQVRGVTFKWNKRYASLGRATKGTQIGLIAQEVEKAFPELVSTWSQEGVGDYRAVDYGRLNAVLVEALKELHKELAELRTLHGEKTTELEQKIKELSQLKTPHAEKRRRGTRRSRIRKKASSQR